MAVTYVVTGATGHIGNNVVRLLADKGESGNCGPCGAIMTRRLRGVSVMRAVGQLSDEEFLRGLIPEGACVVHCAGKIAISERERKENICRKCRSYAESGAHMRAEACPSCVCLQHGCCFLRQRKRRYP